MRRWILTLVIAGCVIGACVAYRFLPLWRDTKFISAESGTVRFPSGAEFPTNRWVNASSELEDASLLQIADGKHRIHYLLQDYEEDRKALLVTQEESEPLIVTEWTSEGPRVRRRIRIGRERAVLGTFGSALKITEGEQGAGGKGD